MKIIRTGKIPSEKDYEVVCGCCKTEFELKAKESHYNSDQYYSVNCPLCKSLCTFTERNEKVEGQNADAKNLSRDWSWENR